MAINFKPDQNYQLGGGVQKYQTHAGDRFIFNNQTYMTEAEAQAALDKFRQQQQPAPVAKAKTKEEIDAEVRAKATRDALIHQANFPTVKESDEEETPAEEPAQAAAEQAPARPLTIEERNQRVLDIMTAQSTAPAFPQDTKVQITPAEIQEQEILPGQQIEELDAVQSATAQDPAQISVQDKFDSAQAATSLAQGIETGQAQRLLREDVAPEVSIQEADVGGTVSQQSLVEAQADNLDPKATVQGQLENISQDIETSLAQGTPLPAFARGAAEAAKATMQARGLGSSTMLAEALAEGILRSSIPIAQQDAATYKQVIFQNLANNQQAAVVNAQAYLQMDMANLSNNQQANLQNLQTRQQVLLTDNAARNAAQQFNATSQNQVNQFYSNLNTTIQEQNNRRLDAMNQFNSAELNKVSALNAKNVTAIADANAQRESAISQFNATLSDQRQRFNVENQRVIDQSNVTWRRQLNTANTGAANAANQTNAENLLNLSNYALSALWQQWRDEASWVNTSSQNEANRNHNLAIAALERTTSLDLQSNAQKQALYGLLGQFGMQVFSKFA